MGLLAFIAAGNCQSKLLINVTSLGEYLSELIIIKLSLPTHSGKQRPPLIGDQILVSDFKLCT